MALTPVDEIHALQIQAGTLGRKAGHAFEDAITDYINNINYPLSVTNPPTEHVATGNPAILLLQYIASHYQQASIASAVAISTGALATSEDGKNWLKVNGVLVSRCKSDLILTLSFGGINEHTFGVSTKQCNNKTPTNAQLYFTTAAGFTKLLRDNGIPISDAALNSLKMFCGDNGFRPLDNANDLANRATDPRRYFWEEMGDIGRNEWEHTLAQYQDEITRLLLQKAYLNDPFSPDFVLHKTHAAPSWDTTEVALYSIDELVAYSRNYGGFSTRAYSARKGQYKDPPGVSHLAPRFGIVQMQRGGQAQHPSQLQFNLQAGYFYKIQKMRP